MKNNKKNILIFTRYFEPGFRAGGPIRSVSNLVSFLSNKFNFHVVCLNRDHNMREPYSGIIFNTWIQKDNFKVFYCSETSFNNISLFLSFFKNLKVDKVYLNSLFDFSFSIIPLVLYQFTGGRSGKIILTPRGELSPSALSIKALRKKIYLFSAKMLGLLKGIAWHACSLTEKQQILDNFSVSEKRVFFASNLPSITLSPTISKNKKVGALKLVLVARISKMKNTLFAIKIVNKMKSEVIFDLYGLNEEKELWDECLKEINISPANVKISYKGEVPHHQVHGILSGYDALFMPTLGENFGHSIIESLDAGLPVIISDRTPWRNLKELSVGADLSLSAPESFVDYLEFLASLDEESFKKIRQNCLTYTQKWKNENWDSTHYTDFLDL